MSLHDYRAELRWQVPAGQDNADLRHYSRQYQVAIAGKPLLEASADQPFRGDPTRHNPEDLLLASLAGCHLLSYLYVASRAGLRVLAYQDRVQGRLQVQGEQGRFVEVWLRPQVTVALGGDAETAAALHVQAHRLCFIANSVNFPVRVEPRIIVESV